MARPERFELPTLWFEARGKASLRFVEFCGFYLLFIEAVAAGLLVFVEIVGSQRRSRLRKRLHRMEIIGVRNADVETLHGKLWDQVLRLRHADRLLAFVIRMHAVERSTARKSFQLDESFEKVQV